MQPFERHRRKVAETIRTLRQERRWTQAELARKLDLSQSRLSELERGAGSFTAEQLLEVLRLFNVPASQFGSSAPADVDGQLQNSLRRLGAAQLRELDHLVPSEQLARLHDVLREALVGATEPRLVTGAGAVLVRHVDRVNLRKLELDLAQLGLERRLGWLLDNLLAAIERQRDVDRTWRARYRRAALAFELVLDAARARLPAEPPLDLLDPTIRSRATLDAVRATASPIANRWGIVTALTPDDFASALEAARARHS